MLKYNQFIKILKETDTFDEYKDTVAKKVLSIEKDDPSKKPVPIKSSTDIETDKTIITNVQKEIEGYEQKKSEINIKIKKLEELLAQTDFSPENKKKIETEKIALQTQIKEFDILLKTSTDKLKKFQESNK